MIYTAGTTGKPKGALRRASDPADAAAAHRRARTAWRPTTSTWWPGPLYHSAPGRLRPLRAHARADGGRHAEVRGRGRAARDRAPPVHDARSWRPPCSSASSTCRPTSARRYDVSSMRSIVVAAAPCPMRVKEEILAWFGPVLYEFYGSTELGVNTVLGPDDMLRKPHSCGRAAPGVELAVLDDAGHPLPAGEPGELYVRRNDGDVRRATTRTPQATARDRAGRLARASATWRGWTPRGSSSSATASAT